MISPDCEGRECVFAAVGKGEKVRDKSFMATFLDVCGLTTAEWKKCCVSYVTTTSMTLPGTENNIDRSANDIEGQMLTMASLFVWLC